MATSNGPDLSAGQRAFRALCDDTCTIRLPVSKTSGAPDPVTYELPTELGALIYDGPCLVRPEAVETNRDSDPRTGGDETKGRYVVKLPFPEAAAVLPPDGAIVKVTSARRDQSLVGRRFIVAESASRTMAVNRSVSCRPLDRAGVR